MKILARSFLVLMLMCVSLTFFACDSNLPELSCLGNITIESVGLENVCIKSNVKNYAYTKNDGSYSFKTKSNSITIYPEKEGYIFSPKSVTISAGENVDVNFVAEQVVELKGSLKLNKIIVCPTVIVNSPENFEYTNMGKKSIKAKDIYIWQNEKNSLVNNDIIYLNKQEQNIVDASNLDFEIHCGKKVSFGLLINTFFKSRNYQESYTSEEPNKNNYTFINIINPQTNADLNNNQIVYNLYGINNHLRTITYNVSFVFDYIAN